MGGAKKVSNKTGVAKKPAKAGAAKTDKTSVLKKPAKAQQTDKTSVLKKPAKAQQTDKTSVPKKPAKAEKTDKTKKPTEGERLLLIDQARQEKVEYLLALGLPEEVIEQMDLDFGVSVIQC